MSLLLRGRSMSGDESSPLQLHCLRVGADVAGDSWSEKPSRDLSKVTERLRLLLLLLLRNDASRSSLAGLA